MSPSEIPVVILCGGAGIHIDDSGRRWSKGLVEVSGQPLIGHLVRFFARYGSRRFVLACGHERERYEAWLARVGTRDGQGYLLASDGLAGHVEVVDTGLATGTGERIRRVRSHVERAPWFWLTYSDTLADVDLAAEARFHEEHGKIATCVAARLPTRFRILGMRRGEAEVRGFARQPVIQNDAINGGFYALRPAVFDGPYLGDPANQVFEEAVLERLSRDGQLMAYVHEGAWQHLDAERDLRYLAELTGR